MCARVYVYAYKCVCVREREKEGDRARSLPVVFLCHISIPYIGLLKDVRQLTTSQQEEVKCHLTQPHLEIACTLVYSDLSTQLRNRMVFNLLC